MRKISEATTAQKTLRLYQKLLLEGRRHFQNELAVFLGCSPQTVIRLAAEIESVIGAALVTGLDKHRRWYQIRSVSRRMEGIESDEVRYLSMCRDLAEPYLPDEIRAQVDQSILKFSLLLREQEYAEREKVQKNQFDGCFKGRIDYSPFFTLLETLVTAMENKLICHIRYKAVGKKCVRNHKVAVGKIVSMNNALYVMGATVAENLRDMKHPINLAVHRMKEVKLTTSKWHFQMPDEDLDMFGIPRHPPRLFQIRFLTDKSSEYVKERIWSDRQKIFDQADGTIILEIVSRSEPEVMAWIRSFGKEAELISVQDAQDNDNFELCPL